MRAQCGRVVCHFRGVLWIGGTGQEFDPTVDGGVVGGDGGAVGGEFLASDGGVESVASRGGGGDLGGRFFVGDGAAIGARPRAVGTAIFCVS